MSGNKSADKAKQLAVVLTEKLNLNMTKAYEVAAMGRTPYTGFFGRLSAEDKAVVERCLKTVGAWELKDRDTLKPERRGKTEDSHCPRPGPGAGADRTG